ncbi:MAG TPA: DUF4359 domain-containing protein [Firmicutes bacterium]|nr:DUF4359 domain-containing protein [Bacillota bacterium]
MRKTTIVILLLLVLAVVAYTTNPTMDHFSDFAQKKIEQEVEAEYTRLLAWIAGGLAKVSMKAFTSRRDYKLYSIYTVALPDQEPTVVLGLFGRFIPMSPIGSQ